MKIRIKQHQMPQYIFREVFVLIILINIKTKFNMSKVKKEIIKTKSG